MNKILLSVVILAAYMASIMVSGFQFQVGDEMGWRKPTPKDRETYNEWAAQNRFRIGDSLHFKYVKDSVMVVSSDDYLSCNTSNPISKLEDSDTVFEFDRAGLFYFISGQPGHCKSGQRLIVRVMHPSQVAAPETAPSPAPTGGDNGGDSNQPEASSAVKLAAVSLVATAFICMFYLFM